MIDLENTGLHTGNEYGDGGTEAVSETMSEAHDNTRIHATKVDQVKVGCVDASSLSQRIRMVRKTDGGTERVWNPGKRIFDDADAIYSNADPAMVALADKLAKSSSS